MKRAIEQLELGIHSLEQAFAVREIDLNGMSGLSLFSFDAKGCGLPEGRLEALELARRLRISEAPPFPWTA